MQLGYLGKVLKKSCPKLSQVRPVIFHITGCVGGRHEMTSKLFADHFHANTGRQEREKGIEKSDVRLQWDPDHDPFGAHQLRRAIQLGLRNEVSGWV